jgi:hypothetical protein
VSYTGAISSALLGAGFRALPTAGGAFLGRPSWKLEIHKRRTEIALCARLKHEQSGIKYDDAGA